MAYATLQQLKRRLDIASNETRDDDILAEFLAEAQNTIDLATDRTFEAPSDTTRRFDAVQYQDYLYSMNRMYTMYSYENYADSRVLWFDKYDICQITQIRNGDGTIVSASDYVTLPIDITPYFGVRLKLDANVTWTWDNSPDAAIEVTGRWAYSVTAPLAIRNATLRLAMHFYRQKDNSYEVSETLTTNALIQIDDLPRSVQKVIMYYKRVVA
jgi:hypothetical protein